MKKSNFEERQINWYFVKSLKDEFDLKLILKRAKKEYRKQTLKEVYDKVLIPYFDYGKFTEWLKKEMK